MLACWMVFKPLLSWFVVHLVLHSFPSDILKRDLRPRLPKRCGRRRDIRDLIWGECAVSTAKVSHGLPCEPL